MNLNRRAFFQGILLAIGLSTSKIPVHNKSDNYISYHRIKKDLKGKSKIILKGKENSFLACVEPHNSLESFNKKTSLYCNTDYKYNYVIYDPSCLYTISLNSNEKIYEFSYPINDPNFDPNTYVTETL